MDLLNNHLTGKYSDEEFGIMEKAYNLLIGLGDYKDVPEILANFTELTKRINNHDGSYVLLNNRNQVVFDKVPSIDGAFFSQYLYRYDDNGVLIKVELLLALYQGKIGKNYHIYEYNNSGELSVVRRYNNMDEVVKTTYCTDYVYDTQGHIINKSETHTSHYQDTSNIKEKKYTYIYNSQGKLTEEIMKETNSHTIYYFYDSDGRLISEKYESIDNPEWNNTTTYTYELCHLYKISQ